jgi:hypothetical protein
MRHSVAKDLNAACSIKTCLEKLDSAAVPVTKVTTQWQQ